MTIKQYILTFINGIFILTVLLFLLDGLTSFEIKSQPVKSFTYFGMMLLTPLSLIGNLWHFKLRKGKMIGLILPVLTLVGILIIGPSKIVFSSPAWRTEKIIYQNEYLHFKKIELQIQDIGALGYNKRIVEVIYLTNLFMIVHPVEEEMRQRVE
jgi:hypothetical protein